MAGTERLHRPIDPPRPAGSRSVVVSAGGSPARWDNDNDDCGGGGRVEGLAVSSSLRSLCPFRPY